MNQLVKTSAHAALNLGTQTRMKSNRMRHFDHLKGSYGRRRWSQGPYNDYQNARKIQKGSI